MITVILFVTLIRISPIFMQCSDFYSMYSCSMNSNSKGTSLAPIYTHILYTVRVYGGLIFNLKI